MLQLSSRVVRSTLYTAIIAANSGLLAGYAPVTQAAQALEEVVVTARKREESVQEVPIAVSAFSAEQLRDAGVSNLKDMTLQVPGVSIDQGSIAQIWVRGVGQRDTSSRIDGPTGIYLDGVYLARKEGQLLDVFDAESIQLLRGPQGTLFGKNTTAGALVITTKKPTNEFGGEISTRVGNYGRWDTKLSVNMPLIDDKLLSKLTVANVKRDGYQTNIVDNSKMSSEDRQAANLQLRWNASDSVTVDGFFYAGKVRETSPGELGHLLYHSGYGGQDSMFANSIWPGDTVPVWGLEGIALANPALAPYISNPGYPETSKSYTDTYLKQDRLGRHKVASNVPNRFNVDNYLAGVTVDWEINDSLNFKSITGYGYQIVGKMSLTADNDGSPATHQLIGVPENSPRRQISQEFQLTGEAFDQKLNYTTGLFAMLENITDYNQSAASPYGFLLPNMLVQGSIMNNPDLSPAEKTGALTLLGSNDMVYLVTPNAYQDEFKQKNKTLAAFFQGSYDVTDQFQVTAGARWTLENRDVKLKHHYLSDADYLTALAGSGIFGGYSGALLPMIFPDLSGDPLQQIQDLYPLDKNGFYSYPLNGLTTDHQSHTWTQISPMASLKYTLPDEWLSGSPINSSMVYFTYSEGFKAGAYDILGTQLSKMDPETIKNFEVGVKVDAFEHTVRLNLAAYKMKYDNQQLIQVIPDPNTGYTSVAYQNAGKSEINGVEAEFVWQPISGLLINAGASYNDYDYKEFTGLELSPAHLYGGGTAPLVDRSSEPFAEVPSITYNLAIQYTFDTRWGSITPRIQGNYKSERYMGLDAGAGRVTDQSTVPGYTRWDARLAYRSPDQKTEVALYVDNLTDKLYYDGAASVGDSVGVFPLVDAPPRMWGIEASYKFGN